MERISVGRHRRGLSPTDAFPLQTGGQQPGTRSRGNIPGLKALAKELKVPVVVLAQLNRGPETRAGKEAGDSPHVRFAGIRLYRAGRGHDRPALPLRLLRRRRGPAARLAGQANLHLAKNRNGPTGDIPLRFEAELMRFSTREPEKIVSHVGTLDPFSFPTS